jgi:integrase
MKIRTHENGFRVDYKDARGNRHQIKKPTLYEARKFASERCGIDNYFSKLAESYLNETSSQRSKETENNLRYKLKTILRILESLGVKKVSDITPSVFSALLSQLSDEGYSDYTQKTYAATYRALCRWLIGSGYLNRTQAGPMKMRRTQKVLKEYLSKEQIAELMQSLEGHWLRLPCALGIYQGLRRSEVIRLKEGDIDLAKETVTVKKSKTREWRVIPFHPKFPEYLPNSIGCNGQPLVRPVSGEWLSRKFSQHADSLGWENITFHSLRHTCASQMALAGHSLQEIAVFLGHSSTETTQKYVHLLPNDVKPSW